MRKQAEKDKLTALYERLSHDDERAGNDRRQQEEQEAEEKRLAYNRERQKEWREKHRASEPEKQKNIVEMCITGYCVMDNSVHRTWKS